MTEPLSFVEIDELSALAEINLVLARKSFLLRRHWCLYAKLVRRGLVRWSDPPPGFSKRRFAGARITAKGLRLLRRVDRESVRFS